MMWWNEGGWGPEAWILMTLTMIAVWGGFIALLVWLFRDGPHRASAAATKSLTPKADQLLAERFARGEIDEDEFTRRRHLLQSC